MFRKHLKQWSSIACGISIVLFWLTLLTHAPQATSRIVNTPKSKPGARTKGTIKTHLRNARLQLRERLTPYLKNQHIPWLA